MKQHLTFFLVLISTLFVTSPVWADDPYLSQELTFRANETTTVYMTKNSNSPTVTTLANLFLQYSTDEGETWETFSASAAASKLTIEAGSTMRLRRNPDNGINTSGLGVNSTSLADRRWYFVTTGDFSVEGNVMSLIDGENFATNTTIPAHCCFNCLFLNNAALTNIDNVRLPATTLKVNCYRAMFQGTGVTDISSLSLPEPETVASYSYNQMFKNCTSLTSLSGFRVPSNLGTYACLNMFQSCTGLTDLVGINFAADTLNNYCYQLMFQACTGLTSVMDTFRVSVIAANSCDQMFLGCTNLRQTPAIKVDSIGTTGCINMFKTCGTTLTGTDSMTAGDIIVSKAIYYQGCQTMYAGSTRLKNAPAIKAGRIFGTTDKNGGCRYMFQDLTGISSAGAIKADIVDAYGCSYMYTGCTKLKRIPKIKVGTFGGTYPFQYMFTGCSSLDFNKDTLSNTGLTDYCYYYMFEKCTGITNTSELYLPADTIAPYAYNYMFTGCTGITDIWDSIQVSVIGNRACQGMFNGCTKLKHSSTLVVDSIGLLGCNAMFKACGTATAAADSMTAGDIIVKKAIYNQGCQEMFTGCTKLKKTPNVYAERVMSSNKTKTGGCYYMFNGLGKVPRMGKLIINKADGYGCELVYNACTTLVAVDTIKINTLGTYGLTGAFTGCTALTKMPKILVEELDGTNNMNLMFSGCSSLTFSNDTLFNKNLTDYCYSSMFSSCTGITNTSGLHLAADTVAPYAYSSMFSSCTGITDMWDTLKVSVIEDRACQNMFLGCTHIKHTPTLVVDSIGLLGCNVMFKNCGTATAAADSMTAGDIIVKKAIYNQGCQEMFTGCTKLKKTPNVYAERVMSNNATKTGGCYLMFNGLGNVPRMGKVDINEVGNFGCEYMFNACSKLKSSDTISIGTLGSYGLSYAFTSCTALPKMPTIKVDELVGNRNMQYMFNACTSLTFDNDTLFNKDLTNYCYLGMFTGCNGLTDIEGLHIAADTLAPYACNTMFYNCANLTSVKDTLRFKVIGDHSCYQMFSTCKKLNEAPVIVADSIGVAGCQQMFTTCYTNASVGLESAGNIIVNREISSLGLNDIYLGCNRLTTAPSVFTKRVGSNGATQTGGCYNMFNSLKITSADYLKIDTVDAFGCELMYNKCASLAAMDTIIMDSVGTQGCWKMFDGCTVLTQAPKIKAGVIGYKGLYQMYTGRTPFTSSDTIFVRLIGENGCEQMFNGCSGLTKLPYIAADSIGLAGCSNMFKSCTALDFDNDILPCSKLGPQAYSYVFNGCNGITDLSQLNMPVTRLEEDCYQFMFNSCLGLVDISTFVLPATEIAPGAYNNMFNACTNLTTAWPVFSPSIIGDYGCYRMFNGCTQLDPAPAITVDSIGPNGCQQMFINCYNSKTATGIHTAGDITVSGTVGAHGLNDIYSGCHYLTTTPTLTAGSIMSNDAVNTGGCYRMFNGLTGLTSAGYMRVGTIGSYGCQQMFQGCTNLLSMDSIIVDSIGTRGCFNMFINDAKFANAPKITADVIGEAGCYQMLNCTTAIATADTIRARKVYQEGLREMFNACTKLEASPYIAIDSVGESGCYRMFGGCSNSTGSTGILTADSLVIDKIGDWACESMFEGCKRLATINGIKNTKMYDYGCYNMFKTCTALVDISDLALTAPIMGAHCYDNMFNGCAALTTIMPRIEVSYIGEQSCYQMFNTCKKLEAAPEIIADSIGRAGCQQMFYNCSTSAAVGLNSAGNIVVNGKIAPLGLNDMYLKCTRLTTAPSVTAGSIESDGTVNTGGCYRMFNGLPNLTSAGDLNVGTIGTLACQQMFYNCAKFAHAPKITADIIGESGCWQMLNCTTAIETADTIRAREIHQEGLREMFSGCKKLSVSPYIISDTIGYLGCYRMFNGCYTDATVGLHKADSIIVNNAIGREGCEEMFLGCQRMDTARAIITPRIHEAGCKNMFQNCFKVATTATKRYSEGFGNSGTVLLGDSACHQMFNTCTYLDSCPDLRFSTVGTHACDKMFLDCNGLDVSPAVTATKVKDYGFYQMFNFATKNTAPTVAPVGFNHARDINIGEVDNYGCSQMFFQCRNLSAAPKLTINKVSDYGCYQMFLNAYSTKNSIYYGIASAGTLSINEIGSYGCQEMFSGCKRLEVSPKIVADSIGYLGCYQMFNNCYVSATVGLRKMETITVARGIGRQGCEEMFLGCQRMDTARAIITPRIHEAGCKNMFQDCFKLATTATKRYSEGFGNSGTVLLGDSACHQMFNSCALLDSCADLRFSTVGAHACDKMFYLCNELDVSPAVTATKVKDYGFYQMFNFANTANNAVPVGFNHARDINIGEVGNRGCYQMFFQCRNLSAAPNLTINKVGDHGCYQMFQNSYSFKSPTYYGIASIGTFNINEIGSYGCQEMFSGCQRLEAAPAITAVCVGAHGCEKMFYNCWANASVGLQTAGVITTNSVANYGYASMFEGCKRLTGVQNNEIRSGFASDYAFTKMFSGCTSLETAPALQVPELGKYACQYMFLGCTSVAAMPVLPAMKIDDYCYSHMFEGCTALATVNPLAVTTLPEGAYEYMFSGCTSLTTAPAMAATTVKPNCYQFMFQGCTSLTAAPTLPATKLATNCYNSMFNNCTALQTAPVLPATALETGCYTQMFNGCTSLTAAPTLPATKLAVNCYNSMFMGCKVLQTAPVLPATSLETGCYTQMFSGCTSLNYMKVNFTDWRYYGATTDPTYNWVASVGGVGQFYCPEGLDIIKDTHHVPANFINQLTTGNKLIFDANTGQWPDGTNERVTINQSAIEDIPHPTKLNCVFTRWNTEADGSGDDLNLGNLADEDITYYAQYQEIGVTLQKWLSNAIFLSITNLPATVVAANVQVVGGGSAKSCWLESSTADEGVYKLVFNKNDVRLHAGGVLDVTLTDEDEVPLGVFSVQIPFLISENTNSSSLGNTEGKEICVLSGATLTFNDNRICDNLVVCAGAKAVIPAGYTLNTNNIVLRGGDLNNGTYSYTSPQLVVNGSIVNTSGKVNYQYLTGLQQQYSLCLPADVDIADVTYPDGTPAIFGITAYDGEKRSQGKTGWVEIWDPTTMDIADAPTLVAGRGYTVYGVPSEIIDGKRRNYCYLNFPLTIDLTSGEMPDADSKTVSVSHFGMTDGTLDAGIAPNNAGWNLIGNPYLANFADDDEEGFGNGVIGELQKNGNDEYEWVGSARYVVIPANNGQSYHAEMVTGTTLPSFKNFFIQVGQGDVLTFAKDARAQNAPGRMLETPKEIMLGVRLEGNGTNDRMALLLGDNFTDEYEINADLDKWSTTSQMTVAATVGKYSLAVAAITTKRSEQPVDLAVKIIKDGSYTFSLAEEWTRRRTAVSHLYLYDKETDTYTDLLNDTYTVTLASGKHNNRFSLITERNTLPTGTDILSEDGITVSRSADGLSISGLGGDAYVTVYSMTGTCLYSAKATDDIYVPLEHGIYIVRVIKDNQTAIYKTEL